MKNIKKYLKICLFWAISIVLFVPSSRATHIVGGNMTYKSIGGDRYEITLSLRRDCFLGGVDAPFDPIAHIGVFSANGALLLNIGDNGLLKIPYTGNDTLNPFIRSDCGFEGTQVCVQEAIYKGILTLPFRNGGYILAYQRCCRNETLANIVDPLRTGATYWVHITQTALQQKNSSPAFIQWPDVYICANKPLVFDHSAVDPDGDSLVYELCLPNKGASFEQPNPPLYNSQISPPPFPFVTWNAPYNLTNVMGGVPLAIDRNTGVLTATPNLVGQFLVGICVKEYRNGVLISEIKRDFQYNVRICSQPPKAFFDTPVESCNGLEVKFTNNSLAAGNFRWYFDWPNQDPAFFSTEANPTFTYPESGIYTVKLRATRGSDGCFDSIIKPVSVFENNVDADFTYRLDECDLTAQTLTLLLTDQSTYNQPGYAISERNWKVIQNQDTTVYSGPVVSAEVGYTGEIKIELEVVSNNGCRKVTEQIIDPNVLIPQTEFSYALENCPQGNVAQIRLTDLSAPLNPFGVIGNIRWEVNGVPYSGSNILVPVPTTTGQITVVQTVDFVSSCSIEKSKSFDLQGLLPKAGYLFEALGCDNDETVNIQLSYDDQQSLGYDLASATWNVTVDGINVLYFGPVVNRTIPKGKVLSFEFVAVFENGCTDTIRESFLPGPFPTLEFTAGSHILCPNQSKELLLNGNADWTYTWSPDTYLDLSDPSNPIAIGTEDITYQVTVTDGICTATGSVEIQVLGTGVLLNISGNANTCDGSVELVVTGGIGQGVYSWSDRPDISNIIGTGDTLRFTFTGKEQIFYAQFAGESCSTTPASFKVINQTPSVITPSPYRICAGDSVIISVFNEILGHVLEFTWEEHPYIRGSLTGSQVTVKVDPAQTENFSLYFTVINQYGCPKRDSILFTIDQNPVADFTFDLTECGKKEICFQYTGTHIGFIQWDFGDPNTNNDVSGNTTPCYTYTNPGTYQVTLKNLTSICPFQPVVKEVVINPDLMIGELPSYSVCEPTELTFEASSNVENVEYSWCKLDGTVIGSGKKLTVTVGGDTSFIVKIKDIYGCTESDTFHVDMFKFDYSLQIPEVSCRNLEAIINLNINNPDLYTFTWLPAENVAAGSSGTTPSIVAERDKIYSVIVTHKETGCQDTREFTLNVPEPLNGSIDGPVFCYDQDDALTLSVSGGTNYRYTWSPESMLVSGQNTNNPVFSFTGSTEVSVIVEDLSTSCRDTFYFTPDVNPPVEIDVEAMPDITVYEGKEIEISVVDPDDNFTYIWSTGVTGTIIVVGPRDNTTYIVTVTDENGCTGTDEITVEVRKAKCDESDIFIPNAFSPNGDASNPVLYVRSNFIEELDFIIYNRWGEEVFRTNDINGGWDGTFKGQPATPDAYAYYIKARCINGTIYQKAGNVTLMR